jgi:hypothetical protein
MVENPKSGIEYKWNHAQPLGEIPEGAQGSFAQTVVVGTRYDDWEVQERLTNGIFNVGTTFRGGDFDQYRFLTHDGITYLVNPTYRFMQRVPVTAGDSNLGIGFDYSKHHPF